MELRGAQEDLLDEKADAAAHRALVESIATGGALAMFDRNSFLDESWRKVILQRTGGSCWVLCDERGEVLDEPDEGCPRGGFSTESFLADLDAKFYSFFFQLPEADSEDKQHDEHDEDDTVHKTDLDLNRAKLISTGVIGTVRTRDGSNDSTIPAYKVMFVYARADVTLERPLRPERFDARRVKLNEGSVQVAWQVPCAP